MIAKYPSKPQNVEFPIGPPYRHTTSADKEAFDRLWNERQEIVEIIRLVRIGEKGHKLAITEIEAIMERIE